MARWSIPVHRLFAAFCVLLAFSCPVVAQVDPALEDAARRAWADLNPGAEAGFARVTVLSDTTAPRGDRVLDALSGENDVRAVQTLTTGPDGLPLTLTFFVVETHSGPSLIPSVPGRTRTLPHLQMVLAPSVQREAILRAGLAEVCMRDRDVPVTDTLAMPGDAFGTWEEVWKVSLCQGGTQWITVRLRPGRWGQEPGWEIVGP
jgi:hypothetical protein